MAKKKKAGGTVKKHGGGMTDVGLYPAEEARAGVLSERERSRFAKKGGSVKRKAGGLGLTKKDLPVKRKRTPAMGFTSKDVKQGKKALEPKITKRRREKIAKDILSKASYFLPGASLPAMAEELGRAMTERRYKPKKREKSPVSEPMAMSKKGGKVSRKSGGKIMVGYKAGGRV